MEQQLKHRGLLRLICILMALVCAGCGSPKVDEAARTDDTQASYSPEQSRLSYVLQTEQDGHRIDIPEFQTEYESAEAAQLNQDITDLLMELYEKDKEQADLVPEIETEFFETSRYLQAVCRYVEYPLVGGYGDVVSYNYDRVQDKRLTLTDALVREDTTLDDVRQMVIDSCFREETLAQADVSIYGVTVDGFTFDEADACTFYGNVDLSLDGKERWSYVYRYVFDTQTVTIEQLQEQRE